jgi:predicted dehydrogenase
MVRIGLVGVGFMGWIHYLAYKQSSGVKLAGVCTRDERRRKGDWRGIQGNFGPPGEVVDLAGVGQYAELAELLADPNIDLVDLCLPPHVHAAATIQALEAGKHVFVEKPMALTTAECERMVTAAKRAGQTAVRRACVAFFARIRQSAGTNRQRAVWAGDRGAFFASDFRSAVAERLLRPPQGGWPRG